MKSSGSCSHRVKPLPEGMRILLVSANREIFPEPVFPIGLAYLAEALGRSGADVRIFDCNRFFPTASLRREVRNFRPEAVGISLRNLDNVSYPCVTFYLPSYAAIVSSIRQVSQARIVLGGPAVSLFPEDIVARLGADAGVRGEGENALEVFAGSDSPIVTASPSSLDAVTFPRNILDVFPDFRRYPTISVQTARGCPNSCIYCTYPSLEGRLKRNREPATVADELAFLSRDFGIRNFFIVDSLFNSDEGHMVRVLEEIAARDLGIRFSCYLQPKVTSPDVFSLLKRAGCVGVDFGTDTGSPVMLDALRKPFSVDDIVRASDACRDAGIDFCHSLLFGGPGENAGTIRETVRIMDAVHPRAVIPMTGIRIYPGTELERAARKEGLLGDTDSLLEPRFYFSAMGASSLIENTLSAAAGRKNWFFPGEEDRAASLGKNSLQLACRSGPLWKTLRT